MQCLIQAVSIEEKKKQSAPAKSAESSAALLQLPHFDDDDVIRKLQKRKVRTLADLQAMERSERRVALQSCGLAGVEVDEVETALSALPCIYLTASLAVDDGTSGKDDQQDILAETDVITCSAHVMLIRPSHQAAGFDPESIKGTATRAYAPNFPFPRDEHWIFMVADPSNNTVLCWQRIPLLEAEAVGAKYASSWANGVMSRGVVGSEEESEEALVERVGQRVDLKFIAPPSGKHDLFLYAMPDSWLGADRAVPLKLRTVEPSRAQREGRIAGATGGGNGEKSGKASKSKSGRSSAAGAAGASAGAAGGLDRSEESELMLGEDDQEGGGGGGGGNGSEDEVGPRSGSGSEDEEDESDDEGEQEWDSDEYGTEESGDEGEETASDEE